MRIITFLITAFFLSMGIYSYAQPQSLGNGLYYYSFPGTVTSNIHNFNADVATDASGNIWVAKKSFGVLKFDGVLWSGYFNRVNGCLPSDTVNCMEIEGNAVYVGTVNGLAVYDGMNWNQYTMANAGLPDSSVSCISVLNANVWIGTNNGLSHKVGNNWVNYNSSNSPLPNDSIYSISQSNNGDLWVASNSGLVQFDGNNWTVFNTQNSNLGHNNILDVCVDNADYLWVNVDTAGLYKLKSNTFNAVEDIYPPYIINPSINKIEKSPIEGVSQVVSPKYYLSSRISLFSFGQQLIRYNNEQLDIKYFTEDANNYWFLSRFGNKLYRLKKSEVDTYTKQVIIDANNIHAGICNRGLLFNDEFTQGSFFEVPAGSDRSTIYGTNLWVAAKDQNGALHTSVESLGNQQGLVWSAGPVMDSVWYKTEADKWDEPWKVYKSEVDYHILHWQDVNYQVPKSISEWPGNGDTTKGQTFQMAPFIDINSNGIYEPQSGDYPQFCGDQAIFFIFNDDRLWRNSIGQHMKVEVHAMAYEFNAQFDSALYNTLFINYKIVNRSDNDYDSLYLGMFSDFDIWNPYDDYIGTDSNLSLIYGYNAFNRDLINDSNPPATGIAFLNKPLTNSMPIAIYSQTFFPNNDSGYFDFMQSVFPNGNHLYYGGNGIDSNRLTNYIYSGLPSDTNQWSEVSNNSNPYDRKMLGSTGFYNLLKDSSINLDWAIIYARNFADTNAYRAVDVLLQRTSSIQAFYQNYLADHCINGYTSIDHKEKDKEVLIYPNPAHSKIYINSSNYKIQSIEIFDIAAKRLIYSESSSQVYGVDISSLSPGMYFIRVKVDNQFIVKKFIKR